METGIDFNLIGIAEAIKQNRFVVPANQREYSWEENQVTELLRDIQNAIRHPNQPYFLGTIVLTKGDDTLEVADGQQRLATSTMILAAIRNWFYKKGHTDLYKSIETDFLFTYDRIAEERTSKLTLNTDDNQFFKEYVLHPKHDRKQSAPQRRSNRLIIDAFKTVSDFIDEFEKSGDSYAKSVLNDWIKFLEKQVTVVMLTVSDADSAFKMFETLNDRGLKTSQVDLVKNHIFSKADNRLDEAQVLWSSMRGAVESVSDNDDMMLEYLRSVCCVIDGPTTKKNIMRVIKDKTPTKTESIRMLSILEDMSKDYAAIFNSDHNKWNGYSPNVRKSLQTLSMLGATQIRPLMLAISTHFNEKNTEAAFRACISWTVRFFVRNIRGSRLDTGYATLANKIHKKEVQNIEDLRREAKNIVVNDGDFRAAFASANVKRAKLARYYLRSLELTASGMDEPEFIPSDDIAVNLEHIMPVSASESWNIKEIESHSYRIGNMALITASKNNIIGNSSFKEKRPIYEASSFQLTSQLGNAEKWGVTEIEERQKVLADLALKTWPL